MLVSCRKLNTTGEWLIKDKLFDMEYHSSSREDALETVALIKLCHEEFEGTAGGNSPLKALTNR